MICSFSFVRLLADRRRHAVGTENRLGPSGHFVQLFYEYRPASRQFVHQRVCYERFSLRT